MSYADALDFTLTQEGGWYDGSQPHDPNPTMRGVIQSTYDRYRDDRGLPRRSVRQITRSELDVIYLEYWDDAHCDKWGERTAMAVMDHSINAGPAEAIKALQRAAMVDDDGVVGPKTLAAVYSIADAILAERVLWERLVFYRGLAAPKGSKHRASLLSWVSRVLALRAVWSGA